MFSKTVSDRFEIIEPYIRTGEVLDLGCVDARPTREASGSRIEHKPDLLFRRIVETNPKTVGGDIDAAGVEALKAMGFNVVCGNAETMELGRQFDTIVAGEIIEHLENPGLFLRNLRRHLKENGTLIVSTPNPFYQGQVWKIWRYGRPEVHEEHANWQDPITMRQLLLRTGYTLVEGCWVQPGRGFFKTWKRLFRGYFAHGFLVVAKKEG